MKYCRKESRKKSVLGVLGGIPKGNTGKVEEIQGVINDGIAVETHEGILEGISEGGLVAIPFSYSPILRENSEES